MTNQDMSKITVVKELDGEFVCNRYLHAGWVLLDTHTTNIDPISRASTPNQRTVFVVGWPYSHTPTGP